MHFLDYFSCLGSDFLNEEPQIRAPVQINLAMLQFYNYIINELILQQMLCDKHYVKTLQPLYNENIRIINLGIVIKRSP